MKSFFAVALLLFAGLLAARAQSDGDVRYIGIYGLIQQADQLAATGEPGEALAAFTDAQAQLLQFQKVFPNWNPNIVKFRLDHIAAKIAELKSRLTPVTTNTVTGAIPSAPPAATNLQLAAELNDLRGQLQSVLAANEQLQAKLKEALAVQPAAVDPRELARAQEKIRWLMKENDLIKLSRGGGQTVYVTNYTKVFVTNSPVEVTNLADVFAKNSPPLVVTNYVRTVVVDTNALAMLRLDYAAAVKNFNDEHARAERLADELDKLKKNSRSTNAAASGVTTDDAAALAAALAENAELKTELAALRSTGGGADAGKLAEELRQARAQISQLQSGAEIAALEKKTLEQKVRQLLAATNNAAASTAAYETRIRELTQERNDLIERLDAANKLKPGKNSELQARVSSLTQEVSILRSRLAVVEAQPVPYTREELALLKSSTPQPANPDAGKKSIKEMPAGTMELIASAQQHFARNEFDQAEADYQKILQRDQNNGLALANLATIELQQGKFADAEKHIKAALAQNPDDAYNLTTLGLLKFREEKYDAALDALSRAAKIDANNPEIQNYLGLTLSHQGQRKPAEAALRRAIEIAPNYAPAHNNLAVIYLSQSPPLAELARWHYQKALAAGQPRNPDLEKLLAEKGAPVQ
jgi:tetratricopeptide (TPR) repeat protein